MKHKPSHKRRKFYGQSLVEYAILLALIAGVVVFGVVQVAPRVSAVFQQLAPLLAPDSSATPTPTGVNGNGGNGNGNGNGNNGCGNGGLGNHGAGNCH